MKTRLIHFTSAGILALLAWQIPDAASRDGPRAEEQLRAASRRVRLAQAVLEPAVGEPRACADPRELARLRDSLSAVSAGLKTLAAAFDPESPRKLGKGLGEAADYLDRQLVPAAEKAAQELEAASKLLQTDTLRLAELLRVAPLDLDAVQQVHDALGSFAVGTDALHRMLELARLREIRGGLQGLDASLAATARQIEHVAGYTYPVMRVHGWKPYIDYKPFWPQGDQIAAGMRDASSGVKAADKELETLARELPKVRAAVDSSRQILERSRDTLAVVLKHRDLIEPLVKSLPETAARLADDLPKLTRQFSATLRDTERLKAMAEGLRETQAHLERSAAGWPEARKALLGTADALQLRCDQLDEALAAESAWRAHCQEQRDAETAGLAALDQAFDSLVEIQAKQSEDTARLVSTLRWCLLAAAALVAVCGVTQPKRGPRIRP